MMDRIEKIRLKTREGNTLELFYNATSGLCVLDLIRKDERWGNELLRMALDEPKLLRLEPDGCPGCMP